jgi:hypothetical protein
MVQDLNTILAESGLVNALYGETGTAAIAKGNAAAFTAEAGGAAAEAGQYQIASGIGSENAQTALISGQLQQFQETRQLMQTVGAQKAGIAGAGFADSGSALDLARSSLQQGLLQNQVLGVNANLQAGGYLEQSAATAATGAAATAAAAAANANATAANNQASISSALAASTGNFLKMIPGAMNAPGAPLTTGPGGLPVASPSLTNPTISSNPVLAGSIGGMHVI